MRFAVAADLHGRRKAWRRFRRGAAGAGADRLIVLGDYLEAEVPWRRHDPSRRWPVDDVVESDPELWAELHAEAELVLGNQELRIRDLLRPDQVPDGLAPLLCAPPALRFGAAFGMHGHQLHWRAAVPPRPRGSTERPGAALEPELAGIPDDPLVMVGHSHQVLLLDIAWGPGTPAVVPPRQGSPRIAKRSVGEAAHFRGDLETHQDRQRGEGGRRTGRARPVPVRPGTPVRLGPGEHGRTLFVNIGPARGKPTHWLLYDDERAEITFCETG